MTYFHALCSPFLILVFGFVFPLFIHVLTLLMHREEIYVQKKKHTSKDGEGEEQFVISDLYSDGNEDMVANFQMFRNTGYSFSDTHARYIVQWMTINRT